MGKKDSNSKRDSKRFKIVSVEKEVETYYTPKNKHPKKRNRLTEWQERRLEEYFRINSYPSRIDRETIQNIIEVPTRNIRIWFQNRRAKEKIFNEDEEMNFL